jgi:hypothetical protein
MSNQKTFGLMDSLAIRVVVLIPGAILFAIRRTQKRFVSVFASPLIILLASANPSMAETERFVEVSLDIEVTHYSSRTDGPEKRRRYSATCVIGEKRWSIDTKFILNAIERYYFDGTNVHRWAQVTEKAPAQPREPGQPILGNPGPEDGIWVKITPGKHPLGHLGVNVVWTAFCSASYLKSPARVIPIP